MKNLGKIQRRLTTLIIPNIIVLVVGVLLSNYSYAQENQELHQKTLNEITKHTPTEQDPHIPVGKTPISISVDKRTNTIYVANYGSILRNGNGTVSVIDGTANKKIGDDIRVGIGPRDIVIDEATNTIYVVNSGSILSNSTVSVIDGTTNKKKVVDIQMGNGPTSIGIDEATNKIYFTNYDNGTVSVIDGITNKKKGGDIPVGKFPTAIGIGNHYTVYVVNSGSILGYDNGTVSVIDGITNKKKGGDIPVGKFPTAVGIDEPTNTIYVVNSGSPYRYGNGTVSVIDGITNKKKGGDIPVGKFPAAIGIDESTNTIYVVNSGSIGTVSVIDGITNKKKGGDIPVGKFPAAIGIDESTNTIYVANSGDGTVSVINGTTTKKIGDAIHVGNRPRAIGVVEGTNTTYVVNSGDGTVSVIDDKENKVEAKVMFTADPFNGGHIECNNAIVPLAQQFYVSSGSKCNAKANEGFGFVSWQENLGGNSTQLIKVSTPPAILDPFIDLFHHDKSDSTYDITKFGNFTANFKAVPPPIPKEYWASLFTVVATALVGSLLIPAIIGWVKSKRQTSRLNWYHQKMVDLFDDGLNERDIKQLNDLNRTIIDTYSEGKINSEQYSTLKNEISILYEEIYKKKIEAILSKNDVGISSLGLLLDAALDDIRDAYAKGRINEQHYKLLIQKIPNSTNNQRYIDDKPSSRAASRSTSQGSPI